MLCCADKLLTKLRLEQELNLGQIGRSGSSLMPVTDVVAVDTLTSQQLRIVKYTATKLLIGLLADQSLVTQVNGASLGVPWQQHHRCSGLATLPSVGAVPLSPHISVD